MRAEGLHLAYSVNGTSTAVLVDTSLSVEPGESVAIMGPSGSGKSTLLRVLAGMQQPDEGVVSDTGDAGDDRARGHQHGQRDAALIYQDYRLVEFLTVAENLALSAELRGASLPAGRATELLGLVGLRGMEGRLPQTLSGGQQQRAAIARAIASGVGTILADEPTGALDRTNSLAVAALLRRLSDEQELSVVIATHDPQVAEAMHRRLDLVGGRLQEGHAA